MRDGEIRRTGKSEYPPPPNNPTLLLNLWDIAAQSRPKFPLRLWPHNLKKKKQTMGCQNKISPINFQFPTVTLFYSYAEGKLRYMSLFSGFLWMSKLYKNFYSILCNLTLRFICANIFFNVLTHRFKILLLNRKPLQGHTDWLQTCCGDGGSKQAVSFNIVWNMIPETRGWYWRICLFLVWNNYSCEHASWMLGQTND